MKRPDLGLRQPPPATLPEFDEPQLEALERLRAASFRDARLWHQLVAHARAAQAADTAADKPPRPLSAIQIGCESGATLLRLAERARARNVPLRLLGCDPRGAAIERARHRAAQLRLDVRFLQTTRLEELPETLDEDFAEPDVLLACDLLPWLDERRGLALFTELRARARRAVLVEDLLRGAGAWRWAGWVGARLARHPALRAFALAEVASAVNYGELGFLMGRADFHRNQTRVTRHWPARVLMHWTRPAPRAATDQAEADEASGGSG